MSSRLFNMFFRMNNTPTSYHTLSSDEEVDLTTTSSISTSNLNSSQSQLQFYDTGHSLSNVNKNAHFVDRSAPTLISISSSRFETASEMREKTSSSQNLISDKVSLEEKLRPTSRSPQPKREASRSTNNGLDRDEEDAIVAQIEDNLYRSHQLSEESHSEKLWKRNLYLILEDPSSSQLAFAFNIGLACLILFSVILTTIETIPAVRELRWKIWFDLELITVSLFTIELILRAAAHSGTKEHLKKFFLAPLTILDILAIVPFYAIVALKRDTSVEFRFTILRVFRLFRLFRAYKYTSLLQLSIEVMLIAVRQSLDALGALFFFMIITILLFSTFLYFAERGAWDDATRSFITSDKKVSEFDSIPASFWFVVATITTTGYGDIVPSTFLGKLIAFPLMIMGILLIALPSVIVGRNFTVVWEVVKQRRKLINLAADSCSNINPINHLTVQPSNVESNQNFNEMLETIEHELGAERAPISTDCELRQRLILLQNQQDLFTIQLKTIHENNLYTNTLLTKLLNIQESKS